MSMSETSVGIIRREERLKLEVFRDDEAAAEAAAEILAPRQNREFSLASSGNVLLRCRGGEFCFAGSCVLVRAVRRRLPCPQFAPPRLSKRR